MNTITFLTKNIDYFIIHNLDDWNIKSFLSDCNEYKFSFSLSLSLFEILYLKYSYGLFRVMQSLRICHGITHKTEFRVDICRWYGRSALIIDAINALVKLSFDFLEAPRWWRVHLDTLTNYITVSFARFAHFLAFPCTNVCVSRNSVPLLQCISSRNLMIGETSVSKIQAMKCTHTHTHIAFLHRKRVHLHKLGGSIFLWQDIVFVKC